MPRKIWRSFNFIVEVAVESPGDTDEDEAAEDAADFMDAVGHAMGRAGNSFVSVVRIDEAGARRPKGFPVIFKGEPPKGHRVDLELPRGLETRKTFYVQPSPVKGKKKRRQPSGGK
jgi:hypothetical protein